MVGTAGKICLLAGILGLPTFDPAGGVEFQAFMTFPDEISL